MMRSGPAGEEAVRHNGAAALRLGCLFRDALEPHWRLFTHPAPETAMDFCLRMLLDTLLARVTQRMTFPSGPELEWDSMVDELVRVATGYLLAGRPTAT